MKHPWNLQVYKILTVSWKYVTIYFHRQKLVVCIATDFKISIQIWLVIYKKYHLSFNHSIANVQ